MNFFCQNCHTVCEWETRIPVEHSDDVEVKTAANRYCDKPACIAVEAAELGRPPRTPLLTAIAWLRANPEGHMGSYSVVKDADLEEVGGVVRDLRKEMARRLALAMRAAGAVDLGYSIPALQEIAQMYDSDLAVLVDAIVQLGRLARG